jgi:hypothetical protein
MAQTLFPDRDWLITTGFKILPGKGGEPGFDAEQLSGMNVNNGLEKAFRIRLIRKLRETGFFQGFPADVYVHGLSLTVIYITLKPEY